MIVSEYYDTNSANFVNGSRTTSSQIKRKPCTKEEFDKAKEEGIKK